MNGLDALKRTVGKLEFQNPLLFGGGNWKTLADVIDGIRAGAAGGEIGTILPKPSKGNDGPNTFYAHWVNGVLVYTLNSLGLPGPGRDAVTTWAREALTRAHDVGKKLGMNIAANSVEEMIEMVCWAIALGFDWVTINGGCPNKFDAMGRPLAVFGFDEEALTELVERLDSMLPGDSDEVWYKPPPFTDTVGALRRTAGIIAKSNVITGYVANNTVPHCFAFDEDGMPAISPGGGLAGMAGPAAKPMVMGHLKILDEILPPHIARVATGGATFGQDIVDFDRHNASLVMATSVFWAHGRDNRQANRMLAEYAELKGVEVA